MIDNSKNIIIVDRDSVCAGDDCEEHLEAISINLIFEPIKFIKKILELYKLPEILGNNHLWNCFLNGEKVVDIEGNNINFISKVDRLKFKGNNDKLFFKYNSNKNKIF